ncbi:MAG: peptidase M56 [Phenylobacterium sp.]|uniref:M56 family metallopeptidase n=1 Tax=Phenylobacterium sp. TaxID=1871053 RepID=UPI001A548AFE|nr:M56 family metallopeptidase [Phenylobacterium sp.]MBL8553537.1 peptidase M56 [Phenylobacterium sp.]
MTTEELLAGLIRVNLVGGLAVLAVLALRIPFRRMFGPELAYGLWAAPPLAAFATLLPARTEDGADARSFIAATVADQSGALLVLWIVGFAAVFAGLALAQKRFMDAVKRGTAGPSVVGVIAPRIVMPGDDGTYSEEERALIRAHEREHVSRMDPRAGALASALQALCWFNPLVHLGAHVLRLDQELACDAAVLRRRPSARALYARTLLKTQLASQPLPFGCYWPACGPHPLEVRIGLLRAPHNDNYGLTGSCLIAAGLIVMAYMGWRLNPPVPPPAPMVELWRLNTGPTMSVMLVPAPGKAV